MRIGYPCITVGVPDANFRTCTEKYATEEHLLELIRLNLDALERVITYNLSQGIQLFRIYSDLIPFGSSPVNRVPWTELFAERFDQIGSLIRDGNMRVSMHPGQYTVLNTPNREVLERAILDLKYHDNVLTKLGVDQEHKIVLHIGGVYGDKGAAVSRFLEQAQRLPEGIRSRLVIENDERAFSIEDVLEIGSKHEIPVVFDNLHHQIYSGANPEDLQEFHRWIQACRQTWRGEDGPQKIHYSQQAEGKRIGTHSSTIRLVPFQNYASSYVTTDLDIMLEVKDKNLSALKCSNTLLHRGRISRLEQEWARYKYAVLERSPERYQAIRALLRDKEQYPVEVFYQLVEEALDLPIQSGHGVNAAQHVWGYFKDKTSERDRKEFAKRLERYQDGSGTLDSLKQFLLRLAEREEETYLLESLYFYL